MKLTLRDLFWLVLMVALILGWSVDHRALARQCSQSEQWQWRAETLKTWILHTRRASVAWSGDGMKVIDEQGAGYNYSKWDE